MTNKSKYELTNALIGLGVTLTWVFGEKVVANIKEKHEIKKIKKEQDKQDGVVYTIEEA